MRKANIKQNVTNIIFKESVILDLFE